MEPTLSILGGRAVVLKGVFVDTGVCVIVPLTNVPFVVVEDANGNVTEAATPVPQEKKKYIFFDNINIINVRTIVKNCLASFVTSIYRSNRWSDGMNAGHRSDHACR